MSIVFAAITPHSPVLVPAVGREHLARLKKTVDAMKRLEQECYAAKPEALLVISPHGPIDPEHFTLDFNDRYVCNLMEFGVFETGLDCRADMKLASDIREVMEDRGIPFMLRSERQLDYGTVVPLLYLTAHMPSMPILPIVPSRFDGKSHFEFGRALQDVLQHTNKRVGVVASADLSHRLTEDAPGGFSPAGREFDEKVVQMIGAKNASGLLNLDPRLVAEAEACGLSPLAIFAGILDKIDGAPEVLSYEAPFGIGCMAVQYRFA